MFREMESTKPNERNITFDVLNILACIAVIALHHNGLVHSYDTTLAWKQSLVAECLFYWCVPVFLMISGANLMEYRKKYSTKVYFKKRIMRTVIPWLFWSVVFLIWRLGVGGLKLNKEQNVILQCISLVINNKVMTVYWFFGALFACYLVIPIFSLLCDNKTILWYIVGLNFVFISLLPVISKWIGISWTLDVPVVGSLLIFVLLGYLLKDIKFILWQRLLIYVAGIAGVIFRFVYTYIRSIANCSTDTSIKGYGVFHSVLFSVAVFVLAINIKWDRMPRKAIKVIPYFSSLSLGIFLIHKFVMYYEQKWLGLDGHRFLWRTVCVLLTYVVCAVIVSIIKKIPFLKNTVP